jgi:hypothetical protein
VRIIKALVVVDVPTGLHDDCAIAVRPLPDPNIAGVFVQ